MVKYYKEYQSTNNHKDIKSNISEQNNMQSMEAYSNDIKYRSKKAHITLEFPYTVDPKDAERFEHMLKEVYLSKIQKGSLQRSIQAVSFQPPKGKCSHCETNSQGGMSHE